MLAAGTAVLPRWEQDPLLLGAAIGYAPANQVGSLPSTDDPPPLILYFISINHPLPTFGRKTMSWVASPQPSIIGKRGPNVTTPEDGFPNPYK